MEVILLERVGRLGVVGDVVKVKNGYGRNFLSPQKKALRATKDNKAVFEAKRAEIEAANAAGRAEAEKLAGKLSGLSVTIIRQASEDGKLYGSVTSRDVAEAVQANGHALARRQFVLDATVKSTGSYTAKIVLHPEVVIDVKVEVVRNEADSEQAQASEEAAREAL
jgi:large subunit ribosomal protein L9